ncbi:TnsA endonuclease C-terminal domain-containing protein [Alicyclobacillus fastidiosus]|uniref:TnsA endonuclease C-terminal domain-containing protein n=1 Tax=Alicyclobacillus fastidiosus TaxID=392011 RepID=A0ABV5AJ45_9BACL|nr:TnsA endonuclease C-terminal domain-containing protein [Alicyclobacillus fastidiosus]WEH10036.1 TnsA endonuclease C-terminal domain-containing protein [Alicyclobacillus fastidiosus]
MDWSNRSWQKEDEALGPKRKVGNRGSQHRPHVIGSFHSTKMNRVVEYESLSEYLFLSLLELDNQTVRYYTQPVEIPVPYLDKHGKPCNWIHVPDVLVFRQENVPHLYQVKDLSAEPSEKDQRVNTYCTKYALERGWAYSVVHPKSIPSVVAQNAKFLMGFLQPRMGFETLIPEVVSRLAFLRSAAIEELSRGFQGKAHPLQVLPVIYHLIANGTFVTNINDGINEFSEVRLASGQNGGANFLAWEGQNGHQSAKSQLGTGILR